MRPAVVPCALLLLVLLLAGCAETRYVMEYGPEGTPAREVPMWPAAPDVPRFLYAGELTGERNFRAVENTEKSRAEAVLAWLVGLARPSAEPARLIRPQSILVNDDGRILVTDVGAAAVYVFDEKAGEMYIWNEALRGQRFVTPIGIAAGPEGQVLVADADLQGVVRLDREGKPLGLFGTDVLQRPTGLARDPERGLTYVADTRAHDIKVFDDRGLLVESFGGPGQRVGEFNAPTHLAYRDGRLYVTDTLNTRIQILDTAVGDTLRTFGERGLFIGNLVRPKGVAVDDEGNIYVIESMHDHLLVFDAQGQFLMPIGGEGQEPGQFVLPAGVTVDATNRVFIADTFNGRVTIFQYLGST